MRPLDPGWWKGKRVLVTGADGFIGQRAISSLTDWELVPSAHIRRFSLPDGDLRSASDARWAAAGCDVILHLAADVGGQSYSRNHSADQYYNCSAIDLSIIEAARARSISRVVFMSCSSAYPTAASSPLLESSLFDGAPRETEAGYGFAKRNQIMLANLYAKQHVMSVSAIISTNVYGPNDHFDETAQLVPALVAKCCSTIGVLDVQGDVTPTRDFVYVDDVVMGLLLAAEHLTPGDYVNIGSGEKTRISTLVETIVELTGFAGSVRFDSGTAALESSRPLDISKAEREIGYIPRVSLRDGLHRTIAWYRSTLGKDSG